MNEKNLVICDKELRYANGLSENISARNEFALRVHICTSLESVMKFKKERELHILIVDEAFAYEDREKMAAEQTFVLTRETCLDLGKKEKEIYKFQSADKILSEVFETYCEQTNSNILRNIRKQKKKLLAVYSPIHRIGKTTFAIALGKELAKAERTLYLNFEEYADIDERFVRAEGRNLGDLLYYMRQEGANVPLRISTMLAQTGDLDYISPFLMSSDLKEVSFEEWQSLLAAILEASIYETVILDLSESVQGLFEILQYCDRIYMPVLEDEISKRKLQQFEEVLRRMRLDVLDSKIHRFVAADDMEMYARKLIKEEV